VFSTQAPLGFDVVPHRHELDVGRLLLTQISWSTMELQRLVAKVVHDPCTRSQNVPLGKPSGYVPQAASLSSEH
jgi:hypothetical protein